jgi:hypothetical protein
MDQGIYVGLSFVNLIVLDTYLHRLMNMLPYEGSSNSESPFLALCARDLHFFCS